MCLIVIFLSETFSRSWAICGPCSYFPFWKQIPRKSIWAGPTDFFFFWISWFYASLLFGGIGLAMICGLLYLLRIKGYYQCRSVFYIEGGLEDSNHSLLKQRRCYFKDKLKNFPLIYACRMLNVVLYLSFGSIPNCHKFALRLNFEICLL